MEHVDGEDIGKIILYALSTCGWCKKTKAFLDGLGVAYDYEYVDKLAGEARESTIQEVAKWNERTSFPTMVINDEKCIVGYKEDEIREALGL